MNRVWRLRQYSKMSRATSSPNISFTPNCLATLTSSSWALYNCHAAESRPASFPESEYPIMTSCFPLILFLYHSTENRRATAAGAASRSASFSKSGTTLKGFFTWHSLCNNSTARTSEGAVAMEIMYAPKLSEGSSAMTCNVSKTSAISSVLGRSGPNNGRLPLSSDKSHSWRFSSGHSRYDPIPKCLVMASITSVCRSDSCLMSSLTRERPKVETWRKKSRRLPSAMGLSPHAQRDRYLLNIGETNFLGNITHTITIATHPRRELDKRGIVRNTFIYPNRTTDYLELYRCTETISEDQV
ncbi:hypothetical protein ACMD2_12101 [Ananas comosus]|uniref:Uncharacterized protein n=1 Tax=Ananas comosus TaxID=4615 RepID=A0A199UEC1_ANACO|nr:hypothetical protein ACMD2_12101 [Ananas comosus]